MLENVVLLTIFYLKDSLIGSNFLRVERLYVVNFGFRQSCF